MFHKIDLAIIGAPKAGTTSLKNYLSSHPQALGHPQVEFAYFEDDDEYRLGFEEAFRRYYGNVDCRDKVVVGKSVFLSFSEKALSRLAQHNPDCKLVFVVREPVQRAYSAYTMGVSRDWSRLPFDELLKVIRTQDRHHAMYRMYIQPGLYAQNLQMVYRHFSPESVRIFLLRDLKQRPRDICRNVFGWMGADPEFDPNTSKQFNQTRQFKSHAAARLLRRLTSQESWLKRGAKRILPYPVFTSIGYKLMALNESSRRYAPMSEPTRRFLHDFFEPHNREFTRLTGLKTDWNLDHKSPISDGPESAPAGSGR